MPLPLKTIFVAGIFRSGQTWLCYLISSINEYLFIEPYCSLRGINHSLDPSVNEKCWSKNKKLEGLVIKTHEYPDPYLEKEIVPILIFRDPLLTIQSEITRREKIISNKTDYDIIDEEKKVIFKFGDILRILLSKFRLLHVIFLAYRWQRYYRTWLKLLFSREVKLISYESLVSNSEDILDRLLNVYLKLNKNRKIIKESIEIFSKKNMLKNANSKNIQAITLGDQKKIRIYKIEQYLVRKLTKSTYKMLKRIEKEQFLKVF